MKPMNEDEVTARRALVEIRRLYLRSNKRDKHTCLQMYRVAEKALKEIEQAADAEPDKADDATPVPQGEATPVNDRGQGALDNRVQVVKARWG